MDSAKPDKVCTNYCQPISTNQETYSLSYSPITYSQPSTGLVVGSIESRMTPNHIYTPNPAMSGSLNLYSGYSGSNYLMTGLSQVNNMAPKQNTFINSTVPGILSYQYPVDYSNTGVDRPNNLLLLDPQNPLGVTGNGPDVPQNPNRTSNAYTNPIMYNPIPTVISPTVIPISSYDNTLVNISEECNDTAESPSGNDNPKIYGSSPPSVRRTHNNYDSSSEIYRKRTTAAKPYVFDRSGSTYSTPYSLGTAAHGTNDHGTRATLGGEVPNDRHRNNNTASMRYAHLRSKVPVDNVISDEKLLLQLLEGSGPRDADDMLWKLLNRVFMKRDMSEYLSEYMKRKLIREQKNGGGESNNRQPHTHHKERKPADYMPLLSGYTTHPPHITQSPPNDIIPPPNNRDNRYGALQRVAKIPAMIPSSKTIPAARPSGRPSLLETMGRNRREDKSRTIPERVPSSPTFDSVINLILKQNSMDSHTRRKENPQMSKPRSASQDRRYERSTDSPGDRRGGDRAGDRHLRTLHPGRVGDIKEPLPFKDVSNNRGCIQATDHWPLKRHLPNTHSLSNHHLGLPPDQLHLPNPLPTAKRRKRTNTYLETRRSHEIMYGLRNKQNLYTELKDPHPTPPNATGVDLEDDVVIVEDDLFERSLAALSTSFSSVGAPSCNKEKDCGKSAVKNMYNETRANDPSLDSDKNRRGRSSEYDSPNQPHESTIGPYQGGKDGCRPVSRRGRAVMGYNSSEPLEKRVLRKRSVRKR